MKEIRWSKQALLDLEDMAVWLNTRNPQAAERAELEIGNAVLAIARRPFAWPQVRGFDARCRSLPKWKRRIIFQVGDDFVLIVSIKHTRQNIAEGQPTTP